MGLCPAASRFTRKAKYLLLLALCLCVLAWISTLSDGVLKEAELVPTPPLPANDGGRKDAVLEALKELDSTETEPEQTNTEEEEEQEEKEKEEKVIEEVQPPKASCPEKSPLLSGAVKLLFESSLTLAQVQEQNGEVIKGQYEPADCTARQSVAILIPHRNREKHLLYLLYHLHPFLQRQQLHYAIYVIHQAGEAKFNRAKLLNVGYLEALKDFNWDCFIFHDVDLVPENDQNLYRCEDQPKHLVVGRNSTGYRLRYKGYFGGVTAMSREQFFKVNGFPNSYWGWGGEDDDLRIRVQLQGMKIIRPPAKIGRYTMVFHKRDSGNEVNKDRMRLLGRTTKMWKKDGLNSCTYQTLTVERPLLYINVTVDIGKPHSAH
ncbi:beta-1,4-galactosyltransferase 4 [Astyanax mexicanus]|uniref:beta-1,4-galactosyltransferase 4 n=1 Tax=Astyanax mexicanus TaxID=7994 RepID=UPI0020CB1D9F|nr:beta-1,4-galactosyltransferase 4 [Astyanax mexicanus]